MTTIHYLPLETYPDRYTEQWARWWPAALERVTRGGAAGYSVVEGEQLAATIRTGQVLDGIGTCHYKATQLAELIRQIERGAVADGDVILLADVWFPGLEMLDYIRRIAGRRYHLAGILHAGSYLPGDYTRRFGIETWARHAERAWLETLDAIFVATEYHRREVVAAFPHLGPRVVVEGLPLEAHEIWDGATPLDKEPLIVFPMGLEEAKGFAAYERFRERVAPKLPGWSWAATRQVTRSRAEYHALLRRASVALSFAVQETFGYSVLEAAAADCHVLAPNRLSYPELLPRAALWNDELELEEKLLAACAGALCGQRAAAEPYRFAADRIIERSLALSRPGPRLRAIGTGL
ncbi:MAG: hypothetical protein IT371_26115 [Deltaproteobacteria bacterium]|nr:hypothetical protein [Deltaproteobacteria bacterium]